MTRILDRYIIEELGPPFAIGVGVFTFFLVIDRIYQLTDLVITKSVPFALVMPLLVYAPRLPRPHPADGDAGGGAAGGGRSRATWRWPRSRPRR